MLLRPLRPAVGWIRRHAAAALYAGALVPAIVMALTQPVWAITDEPAHYDVVAQVAHGQYPRLEVPIRSETFAVMREQGWYRFLLPQPVDPPEPPAGMVAPPSRGASVAALNAWAYHHMWQYPYEAVQPPLYYAAAAPVWWVGDAIDGPLGAVYALRIVNALLVALLAPITFLTVLEIAPGRRGAAALAAAVAAVLPGPVFTLTSVTDDALLAALGALTVLATLRVMRSGWTARRALLVGLLAAAAVLAKPTALGVVAGVLIAALLSAGGWRRGLTAAGLVALPVAAGLGAWQLANRVFAGHATDLAFAQALNPPTPVPFGWWTSTQLSAVNLVGGDAGDVHPGRLAPLLLAIGGALVLLAVATVLGSRRRRGTGGREGGEGAAPAAQWLPLLAVGLAGVYGAGVAVALAWSEDKVPPGRYVYPLLPLMLAALVAWGLRVLPRLFQGVVPLAIAGLSVWMLAGYPGFIATPDRPAGPPAAATAVPLRQAEASRDGLTITVDGCRSGEGALWLHVDVVNGGAQLADWSPWASSGNRSSDIVGSTPMRDSLLPGESTAGWLRFDGDALPSTGTATLTFPDVATAGYATVGDLRVTVTLG